jgi:thiosulfate/3-mercaptopyruvate sulfurtransferase
MGFWLMKLYGHVDVRILDSSRDAWRTSGHPWSNSANEPANTGYRLGETGAGLRADRSAVQNAISGSRITIADVRSEAEYRGERFWPSGGLEPSGRAGHVPSAVHQPCTAWFALTYLLGREQVRVYDGSWAEWGRTADTPVERS